MFRRTQISTGVLLAISALAAMPSWAQDAPQRVEITGSSIKRVASEGALPVQTFTQEDIKKTGVTTVTDFIQQLPVMQGFTVAADSVGGGGGGITTASIHDVGEQYTLVLLNGRRVAPATSGTTIDLNSIPLAAIDRVEVLTDGASALYGSDAIAGVVNFILKKGAAPFQLDLRASQPEHRGAESMNIGLSKGIGDLQRDGFSLFASLSYDKSKQLKASQRDFAKTGIIDFTDQFGRQLSFFNGSSRSIPPNVDVRYTDPARVTATNPTGTASTSLNPYLLLNGNCPPSHVKIGRQCYFDYTSTVEISPEQERTSLFTSGELKLGASGFKAFADLAYTDAHILARIAPYPAEFRMAKTHPYYAQYIAPYLTPLQQSNLTSINVKYRLYDVGNRAYDYQTKATHLVAGVDGTVAGWDVNSAATVSRQKQLQNYVGGFPLESKFNDALNSLKVDPFPYTLGTMPAAQLAALRGTQWIGTYNTTDIQMSGVDARASREVFKLGGGAAMLGLGADFRKTSYKVTANKEVANAEILFDDPQPEYDLNRKNAGVFAELVMPVIKGLELTAGARFDSISGVEDKIAKKSFGSTETATTYKLSGRYQLGKAAVFRGSYGTGFRTATMQQIAEPKVDFGVTGGSYNCPFNAGYDPLGFLAKGYVCPDKLQYEVFHSGNAELKPEKSTQWTLGVVFEPMNALSVALDLWNVEVSNAVQRPSERLILTDPVKYLALYAPKFKASNGLTYVAINQFPINIGKVQNQGLDWDFTLKQRTDFGRVTGRIGGTYLIRSRYTTPGTSDQWESSLGTFGSNDAVSFRNLIRASGSLERGNWNHTLTMNYRSGYKDIHHTADDCAVDDGNDCIDTQLIVPEYVTLDWQTKWTATKNLDLTLGVVNIGDVKPPLSLRNTGSHQLGYDPRYASALGRSYYLSASFRF